MMKWKELLVESLQLKDNFLGRSSSIDKMQIRIPIFIALAAVLLQVSSAWTLDSVAREDDEMERIIGGRAATEGQFPWATVLFYNEQFICSSSIIGPRTILTAAHCVVFNGVTEPAESFHAIANYRKSANEVRIDFESVTPHPNYTDSNGIQNDIAILTTTEPIPFSDTVQPVCIAREDTPAMEYKKATAMGWGFTNRRRSNLPDELQYVEQKIIDNRICSIGYLGMAVEETKICGGFLNGICNGDSGGPLVHLSADKPPVEIGVASYISGLFGCGSPVPGVWTRVSAYNDFLTENSQDELCTV